MLKRAHHRRIEIVLRALDHELLINHQCYFGGGTAIALAFGEYRESVDIDFEVSSNAGYRELRSVVKSKGGIANLFNSDAPIRPAGRLRVDQYGIRTFITPDGGPPIKFEIISEGRITLDSAGNEEICGTQSLSARDMVATKLLANSDRWADPTTHHRDIIDIAMMSPDNELLRTALEKAEPPYQTVKADLEKAIERVRSDPTCLDKGIKAMKMDVPRAVLWKNISTVSRRLAALNSTKA